LVIGKTFKEHLDNLREVFQCLQLAGLRLMPSKCLFAGSRSRVVYLGFVISREGIAPDLMKVEAVMVFPQSNDMKSFLGLVSYYRRFIYGFSVVANPLFSITKKDVKYDWSPACEAAFQQLKKQLTEAPILAFPDFSRGFLFERDVSGVGLGAVLTQKLEDGTIRPITYAIRTLQPHECVVDTEL